MSTEKKQGFASFSEEKLREVSSKAGRAKHPNKGFGSLNKKTRRKNASEASKIRWARVKAERMANEANKVP